MLRANRMLQNRLILVGACGVMVAVLAACQTELREDRRPEMAATGTPPPHAVHSVKLRHQMRRLNWIVSNPSWAQSGLAWDYATSMVEMREAAGLLAETAEHIPDGMKEAELSEEQRRQFTALAVKLRDQSLQLQEDTRQGDVDICEQSLHAIVTTCSECHLAFRVMPDRNQ